jgi:hypothetical protein
MPKIPLHNYALLDQLCRTEQVEFVIKMQNSDISSKQPTDYLRKMESVKELKEIMVVKWNHYY